MPWACVGSSKLGVASGPGKPNCGLGGTFNKITGLIPQFLGAISVAPTKPDTQRF